MSHQSISKFTVRAAENIDKHLRVNRDGTVAGIALDFGVARAYADAGTDVALIGINAPGSINMIVAPDSGNISDGQNVYSAADGKISSHQAAGAFLRGVSMQDGVPGDTIQVLSFAYPIDSAAASQSQSGYEFSAGFSDRQSGQAAVSLVGDNVSYTADMVAARRWMRFGFSSAAQLANDFGPGGSLYWTDDTQAWADAIGVGVFAGRYMPAGVTSLFDYDFNSSNYSDEVVSGDLQYTAADGSYDFRECQPGDYLNCRFDFNVVPQIANTTLEVGLIWQTRDANDNPTFTFDLVGSVAFFGQGTVGETFLQRPVITAYFAGPEDVNARALPAIRADNPIEIQPLTTLCTIIR